MQKLYLFFKSVKLAVVLLIIIAATAILATLIPQNKDLAFYYHTYPRAITWLIINTQFNTFFRSLIFLSTIVLFTLNLTVCALDRVIKEFLNKRKKRFGPDLIHFGLLILLAGAIVTAAGRREGFVYMAPGDSIKLPGDIVIELESYEFLTYENGRPKDWISTVSAYRGEDLAVESFPIEVNKPLKIGNIEVYQSSYGDEARVDFTDGDGTSLRLSSGKSLETSIGVLVLEGLSSDPGNPSNFAAHIEIWQNMKLTSKETVLEGSKIANLAVANIEVLSVTGLNAVIDPGFIPVLIGFIMSVFGLMLTYYQKIGDKQI